MKFFFFLFFFFCKNFGSDVNLPTDSSSRPKTFAHDKASCKLLTTYYCVCSPIARMNVGNCLSSGQFTTKIAWNCPGVILKLSSGITLTNVQMQSRPAVPSLVALSPVSSPPSTSWNEKDFIFFLTVNMIWCIVQLLTWYVWHIQIWMH